VLRHPLTLDHIARELDSLLRGAVLVTAWTQEKHTCTLGFVLPNNTELYIHINTDHTLGTILTASEPNRAKRNSLDVFPMLTGAVCRAVVREQGDRSITFSLGDYQLTALLYSSGAGNVVVVGGSGIVDALHDSRTLVGTPFHIDRQELKPGKHLSSMGQPEASITDAYAQSRTYYVLEQDGEVLFSALPIPGWEVSKESNDLFQTLRYAVRAKRFTARQQHTEGERRKALNAELRKLERTAQALNEDARKARTPEQLRHQADLLMSHPSSASAGQAEVALTDWDGTPVSITLDAKLTILENAQALYSKARRAAAAAEEREQRRPEILARIQQLQQQLQQLDMLPTDAPDNSPANQGRQQQPAEAPPYRTFELPEGYMVYVGRNSANNDQLTMRFAKQNDYWLHVRGQSGSHAVLRAPSGAAPKPPKRILEQAAAIAAYYSSARNASWTPVVYTLRKHVRKPKGAAVGAVVLDREEVIMVKPGLPGAQAEQA
jgi:predicted ribosome quality control (RQC) complex YloA/Tae2 family protein